MPRPELETDCPLSTWLLRTPSGFCVEDDGIQGFRISADQIASSKYLSDAFSEFAPGSHVGVQQSLANLRAWHSHMAAGIEGRSSPGELFRVIQAADYLNDPQTLNSAIAALATKLFAPALARPRLADDLDGLTADQPLLEGHSIGAEVHELASLQEHLVVLVLRAALNSMPPCIVSRRTPADDAYQRRRALRLHALLRMLPAHLQPLSLRAYDTAVDDGNASLSINASAPDAAAAARVAGRCLAAHLTALHMWMSHETLHGGGSTTVRSFSSSHACSRSAAAVSDALARLTALQHLALTSDMPVHHHITGVLSRLTALTHLAMRGAQREPEVMLGLARSLRDMPRLRHLDISTGGLGEPEQAAQLLRGLAGALCTLTALSALSLFLDTSYHQQWPALAPAVAALSLSRLELHGGTFKLREGFDLLSGHTGGGEAPLADVEHLLLSYGDLDTSSRAAFEFLPRLPHLKQLEIHTGTISIAVHAKLLQSLRRCRLAPLQELKLVHVHRPFRSIPLRTLGAVLRRCTALRTVRLSCHAWREALQEVGPALAALPALRELCLDDVSVLPGAASVPAALTQLSGLTALHICMRVLSLETEAASALAQHLPVLTALRVLSMQCQKYASDAGSMLGVQLGGLVRLTDLQLSGLKLTSGGAGELATEISCMTAMRRLCLSHLTCDAIDGRGLMQELSGALRALRELSVLRLTNWESGDTGAAALAVAEVISGMSQLQHLDVSDTLRPEDGQLLVQTAPSRLQTISV